ncbi:serine-rich adhesin for platelets [Maniola jurtina]|uniref:serine-rich adhesin for platelets n=1 Tax=Maniola jurtina TaxID=191418 RepID=UPI001E68D682|nr:serine-rich adhesin for platelets [Maniola jurtina]
MLKMSTRSRKRIHGSIHENAEDDVAELKSERKTRGKRQTDNYNEIASAKKRKNYVRYPSEEDIAAMSNAEKLLKEQNIVTTKPETLNDDRTARLHRRTRKSETVNNRENMETDNEIKTKLSKNNKKVKTVTSENTLEPILQPIKKKSNKKKNKRKSGSIVVEDISQTNSGKNNLSNMSVESFYSAAGSPFKDSEVLEASKKIVQEDVPSKSTRSHDKVLVNVVLNHQFEDVPSKATTRSQTHKVDKKNLENAELKSTKRKNVKRKKKLTNENLFNNSLTKATNAEEIDNSSKVSVIEPILQTNDVNNITQDKQLTDLFYNSPSFNNSLKNSSEKRRSKINSFETVHSIKIPDKLIILDTTKENNSKVNSTYDKINISETYLNVTFNKEVSNNISENENVEPQDVFLKSTKKGLKKKRKSTNNKINVSEANLNATFGKDISNECVNQSEHSENDSTNLNVTGKNSNKKRTNSTYDKINFSETSLNATFDEKMCENPIINVSEETQMVLTNGLKNSDKKKRKSSDRKLISDEFESSDINLDATDVKNNSNLKIQTAQSKELRKSKRFSKTSLDQVETSNLNTTYDKSSITDSQPNSRNNSTFDKSAKINTTFEMVTNTKLDATFDKSQNNDTRRGSSLISSDTTGNASSEISKDISRISITSDESVVDNVVNISPFLIESSIDDSQINISSHEANKSTKPNAEIKNAASPPKLQKAYKDNRDITLEEMNIEMKSKTPPKCDEIGTEITCMTPLIKKDRTYTEIKYSTPTKYEGTCIETKKVTTPKSKDTFTETKVPKTSLREGTYTELKTARTPLKREGTYTELNPTTTPSKNDAINTQNTTKTPIKFNDSVENKNATPTLKREGTFTKDSNVPESPKVQSNINKTPIRRKSLPSPGRTPFPIFKTTSNEQENGEKSILNITRSIEKSNRRSSVAEYLPRATKVMFCSPVATPMVMGQMKGKVIKSNLKGSDKSFVFDESVSGSARPPRKRSHTQSEAEGVGSKRTRLTGDQRQSVQRLSRPRTASASGKLQDPGTPSKKASTLNKSKTEVTPFKSKPEGRVLRTKLPNFAALHQKHFAKMESLDECQERKAKRARQLLTPTGSVNLLERISPKEMQPSTSPTEPQTQKAETSKKSIIPPEHKGYTRFGFKLNTDVNPFSFTANTETKPKQTQESTIKPLKQPATLPSRAGATKLRREAAKQTVMREKSFAEIRDIKRNENRTIIKGVRTNRRFELQMKMRNVNN